MPPRKKSSKKISVDNAICVCGGNCHDEHSHLPGLLLTAAGLVALPLNFGMVAGLEWAQAWPLALVVLGIILSVKVLICKNRS